MKFIKKVVILSGAVLMASLTPHLLHAEESPYTQPDGSWISLSGTVAAAEPNYFQLDYGEGTVTVEMDDWDWYADGYGILEGDNVVVYGRVDDDLYEITSIEAGSVYVKGLNTYFYANPADEEDVVLTSWSITNPWVEMTGTVTSVNGREFTLDTDTRTITVDTSELAYNPMDNFGYQKIDKGDRVTVYGDFDLDLFEGRELEADSVITLIHDKGKSDS